MTLFFTADQHFGHKNILTLGKGRPFLSLDEMNQEMIDRWNSVVTNSDMLYYIGDFAYKCKPPRVEEILGKLNGRKYLITGNHDDNITKKSKHWQGVWDYREIKHNKQRIVLSHYPMREWNGSFRGSWMLHGHCHGNLPDDPYLKSIDVGVDSHDFTPISFEQVMEIMSRKLRAEDRPALENG